MAQFRVDFIWDMIWVDLHSFRGRCHSARLFWHKIDCSTETIKNTTKVAIEHCWKSYVFCPMTQSLMTLEHISRSKEGDDLFSHKIPLQEIFALGRGLRSLRHILSCCWKESVKPLQYFCQQLPFLIDRRLWQTMIASDSSYTLLQLITALFVAIGSFVSYYDLDYNY